ncbi:MAG: hypothetical protein HY681_03335 [Chloroflexi bacterium]|nr:hypothetical protein [Chloroflexota bacterium]
MYEFFSDPPPNQRDRWLYARFSDDGVTFEPAALLPNTGLDRSPTGGVFQSVPDLIALPDGSLRLYYVAGGLSVASMRSTDGGQTWVQEAGYRLLSVVMPSGRYGVFVDPDVIRQPDGTFFMYFAYSEFEPQCGGLGCQRIRLARSSDGLNFTVDPDPLLVPSTGVPGLVDPDVYQAADGRWYMLFGEHGSGEPIRLRIAVRAD